VLPLQSIEGHRLQVDAGSVWPSCPANAARISSASAASSGTESHRASRLPPAVAMLPYPVRTTTLVAGSACLRIGISARPLSWPTRRSRTTSSGGSSLIRVSAAAVVRADRTSKPRPRMQPPGARPAPRRPHDEERCRFKRHDWSPLATSAGSFHGRRGSGLPAPRSIVSEPPSCSAVGTRHEQAEPVPLPRGLVVKNGSPARASCSSFMPPP
jgi:hypothetical protein